MASSLASGFDAIDRKYDPLPADVDRSFRELVEQDYLTTEVNYFRTIFCASLAKLDFTDSFPAGGLRAAGRGAAGNAAPRARRARSARWRTRPGSECGCARCGGSAITAAASSICARRAGMKTARSSSSSWPSYRGSAGEDPRPAYEAARAQALAALPWHKRRSFERKLDRLRRFVWLREEMRDLSTRLYYHIRRHLLEIARRRGLGDDIFFMTFQEIIADDRRNIDRSREVFESYRNFKAPNEIGVRFPFRPTAGGDALQGIGASQGVVRGIARIARSVEEAARVEQGAILVCPFTDPGWTVTLDRVAGVRHRDGRIALARGGHLPRIWHPCRPRHSASDRTHPRWPAHRD